MGNQDTTGSDEPGGGDATPFSISSATVPSGAANPSSSTPSSSSTSTSSPAPTPGNETPPKPAWNLQRDGWAALEDALVRPGMYIENERGAGSGCSANFLFTNPQGTKAYIGTAAHCYGMGADTQPSCDDNFAPLDDHPVAYGRLYDRESLTVIIPPAAEPIGHFVYSSFVTMQDIDETRDLQCMMNDFALIELDDAAVRLANPAMWHYGGPIQLSTDKTANGDVVHTFGGSSFRHEVAAATRPRDGVVTPSERDLVDPNSSISFHAMLPGMCIGGDSGSPVLDDDGQALGIVTRSAGGQGPSCRGAYLAPMLDYMAANAGIEVVLATADELPHVP